jgi:protein SCO1/2
MGDTDGQQRQHDGGQQRATIWLRIARRRIVQQRIGQRRNARASRVVWTRQWRRGHHAEINDIAALHATAGEWHIGRMERQMKVQLGLRALYRVARLALTPTLRLTMFLTMALTLVSCGNGAPLRGVTIDPPREVPAFSFTRASGLAYSTGPEGDHFSVLFFGYTHCPDVCRTTLSDWQRVKRALGEDAARVRWLFVTVDPARDTRQVVEQYAQQFDSTFIGLSGDSLTTSRIQAAFGVSAIAELPMADSSHLMSHSSQVFLVDPLGRLVAMYPLGSGVDALLADLRRLL